MATKEISSSWLEIQQDIKHDFLTYITKPELVKLVKSLNLKVQGFSKRNAHKAHEPMLRQAVSNALDNTIDLQRFFKMITKPFYHQMKDYDYDTFILKASLEDELSRIEKLLLLAILFPDNYKNDREQLILNLENNQDTFFGFVEPDLSDRMSTIVGKYDFNTLMEKLFHHVTLEDELPNPIDLHELFSNQYEDLTHGYMLQLLKDYDLDEDFDNTEQELHLLYQLAFAEAIFHAVAELDTYKEVADKASGEKSQLESKIGQLTNRRKDLMSQLKEKERDMAEAERAHKMEIEEIRHENKALKKAAKELNDDITVLKKSHAATKVNLLQETDPFFLITKSDKSVFTTVIPEKLVLKFDPVKSFSEQFKSLPNNKIIFIDANQLTSKQQITIENYCHFKKLSYKFVSGAPELLIRQIIFYLEGDIADEINQ